MEYESFRKGVNTAPLPPPAPLDPTPPSHPHCPRRSCSPDRTIRQTTAEELIEKHTLNLMLSASDDQTHNDFKSTLTYFVFFIGLPHGFDPTCEKYERQYLFKMKIIVHLSFEDTEMLKPGSWS